MASFNLPTIERFYLTSCSDLSYKPRQSLSHVNLPNKSLDLNNNENGNKSVKKVKDSKTKTTANPLQKIEKEPSFIDGMQIATSAAGISKSLTNVPKKIKNIKNMQGEVRGSILKSRREFKETFQKMFERPPPKEEDYSWIFNRNEGSMGLARIFDVNNAPNIVICVGALIIGIFSILDRYVS